MLSHDGPDLHMIQEFSKTVCIRDKFENGEICGLLLGTMWLLGDIVASLQAVLIMTPLLHPANDSERAIAAI